MRASGDWAAVLSECRRCRREGREISDACAKAIARMFYGAPAFMFLAWGIVPEDPSELWRTLFPDFDRLSTPAKTVANMMNTYLTTVAPRGPVDGWSELRVREG